MVDLPPEEAAGFREKCADAQSVIAWLLKYIHANPMKTFLCAIDSTIDDPPSYRTSVLDC